MEKAAQCAAIGRRRLLNVCSVSLTPSLHSSRRPPPLLLGGYGGSDKLVEALPVSGSAFLSIFFQNRFSSTRPPSVVHDPCGRGNAIDEDSNDDEDSVSAEDSMDDEGSIVEWEEEEETDPMIGDGGDGGGVVLGDVKWGEHALALAREVLLSFGNDITLHAFKVSPKGYIYVRLDKLANRFGCPDIGEIENFSNQYKKRLDEAGETGAIPDDMAIEVSSPGAERLLKVPQDLIRFQDMPMWVRYLEEGPHPQHHKQRNERVLMLESVDNDTEKCIFKLADVRENRAEHGKGRPLSRKQKDWRLTLPFKSILSIKLYLDWRN